jgi:hypothetical protein
VCTWYPVSTAWLELRNRRYNTFDADFELSRRFGGSCARAYRPGGEQVWSRSRHRNCRNRRTLLGIVGRGDVASAQGKVQRRVEKSHCIVLRVCKRLGRVILFLKNLSSRTHSSHPTSAHLCLPKASPGSPSEPWGSKPPVLLSKRRLEPTTTGKVSNRLDLMGNVDL